ncbi:MAG TPA: hypothetical protein VG734_20765 [Lacunisphaera sp.]|nr:hypothetical protein [Lacunisphaera sp.]
MKALPKRNFETDGIRADLMAVVCAWCGKNMGAKVCAASQVGQVSHGMCPACERAMRAEAGLPNLVSGECLESEVRPSGDIAPADAGSPAASFSPATGMNGAAAVTAGKFQPEIIWPAQVKGTTAPGAYEPAVLEHPSGGPVAAFTFTRPLFWLVTGADFGRANAAARRRVNSVVEQIRRRMKP